MCEARPSRRAGVIKLVKLVACLESNLRLCDGGGAFVFLRQEEADGHEELVDADPELLLVLAPRCQGEEAAGLDDVLEDVLAGLAGPRQKRY